MNRRVSMCAAACMFALTACGDDDGPGGGVDGGGTGDGGAPVPMDGAIDGGETPGDITQDELDAAAAAFDVTFEVVENIPSGTCPDSAPWGLCYDATITIQNTGDVAWDATGWALYFSNIRKVLAVESDEFSFEHINGDLHRIMPTDGFAGFEAGESKQIAIQAEYWVLSETDVMPRFYLAAPGLTAKAVADTDTESLPEFVAPFTEPEQQWRTPDDESVIETAATRYASNAVVEDLGVDAVAAAIVPTPKEMTVDGGSLDLSGGVTINAIGLDSAVVESVAARLTLLGVAAVESGVPLTVSVDADDPAFTGKSTTEAYSLDVTDSAITIVGGDAAGAFYGLQSFLGLVPGDVSEGVAVPQVTIGYDAPRFGYRGVQLDIARNFPGKDAVLAVLEQMAAYKLNTLHLHLSDDEGWRLAIPGLPELTEVGARRCHDLSEQTCLLPQLGSGPSDDTAGTGHLTRDDFIEILEAATARHIEVVPELDMPGHARAAIKAMEVRAAGGDTTYLLSDPEDTSAYTSVQYYDDNAMNGCMESSYAFVEKVMDEVEAMYDDAGATLSTWHVGGDEVGEGAWTQSPACEALYESEESDVDGAEDVHAYFVTRVNQMAMDHGFALRGWSDGLRKTVGDEESGFSKVFLDPETDLGGNTVSTNWWGTLFWWDDSAYTMANAGYEVILTSPDFLYFDHPYEADPKERGYYWATRYTDVEKMFSYMPGNLPANAQISRGRMGEDYSGVFMPTEANPDPVAELTQPANIIGMEGALWSETVRSQDQLEYMVFPRLLALAERAWHRAAWEPSDGTDYTAEIDLEALAADWERFANTLGHKELPKLDKAGVHYRIEVPGATVDGGTLDVNVAMPGLAIEYKDGDDWVTFDPGTPPTVTTTEVRARATDGRVGRPVSVATP